MQPSPAGYVSLATSDATTLDAKYARRRASPSLSPSSTFDTSPSWSPLQLANSTPGRWLIAIALFFVLGLASVSLSPADDALSSKVTAQADPGGLAVPAPAPVVEEEEELDLGPRKANATIVILVSPRARLNAQLFPTLRNTEDRFNRRLGYPYQLLTDGELPSEEMQEEASKITGGKTTWSLMTKDHGWTPPDWISEEDIEKGITEITGFPLGYRNMCRFYSGFFWKHPAVAKFDYIWRLDEGVKFWCDLDYDPFLVMQDRGKKIGYSVLRVETPFVVEGLWEATREFFSLNPQYVAENNNEKLVSNNGATSWNHRIIYNNFEISDRTIWESEAYTEYFKHIDQTGGIYRLRWGDAPIHTLALAHILPASEWISFSNSTGYQHGSGKFECPDTPLCSCDPNRNGKAKGKGKGKVVKGGGKGKAGRRAVGSL